MLATRSRSRAVLPVVACTLAAVVAGCGSSSSGSAGASSGPGAAAAHIRTVPESAIARAADVTSSAKGYAFDMSMVEDLPNSEQFTVGGTGTYSTVSHSGTFNLTLEGQGVNMQIQEIAVGETMYMKMPASLTAKLPGAKPWLELDFGELKGSSYLSDVGSLMNSSSESSPTAYLEYLKAASTNLQDLGRATINGVSTTHYRASLDLEKAAANYPTSTRATLQNMIKKMPGVITNETDIPVDVWIDGSDQVRKMTMSMQLVPKGTSTTVNASIVMSINGYGPQATPAPPPADQTTDLIALLRSEGKLSQLGG